MNKRIGKLLMSALVISVLGGAMVGCGTKQETTTPGAAATATPETKKAVTIAISGSTSVGPLMEKEAKAFMDKNTNVKIEIQQIGSSAGIKNAIDGVSEIGMSSRDLKDEEKAVVKDDTICFDGIGIAVHPSNTATNLTKDQLKGIYTGKITNWKEVGGKDAPIVVVSREEGSGTRDAFQEIVGFKAEELIKAAQISQGNGAVKTTVSTNENAIGYVSFDVLYKDGKVDPAVKALKVEGVEPTADNVKNKSYKISRPFLVVYKDGKLSQTSKDFIAFIKGDDGQKIVKDSGVITLK
jgi:phosphate transport system substrate-binding protein